MPRAIVCAYSPVGASAMLGLLDAGFEVATLYTYPQAPSDTWYESPAEVADRHRIPIQVEPDFNAEHVAHHLESLQPDFLFSFYFREMISPRILNIPAHGSFNLHGSLLPKYRGRAPLNWALVHGETETGITLHEMTPKPDDGDIVAQLRLPIAWDETALSLTRRAAEAARSLVREAAVALTQGTATRTPQKSLGSSSYFGGRKPEDSRLDFHMTTQEAFNQIRAVADPWPNAYLEVNHRRIHVPWALPASAPCPQGLYRQTPEGLLLGFRDGALRIHTLRLGNLISQRPTEQAAWLCDSGIPAAT